MLQRLYVCAQNEANVNPNQKEFFNKQQNVRMSFPPNQHSRKGGRLRARRAPRSRAHSSSALVVGVHVSFIVVFAPRRGAAQRV